MHVRTCVCKLRPKISARYDDLPRAGYQHYEALDLLINFGFENRIGVLLRCVGDYQQLSDIEAKLNRMVIVVALRSFDLSEDALCHQ